MHRQVAAVSAVLAFFGTTSAFAQNYPERPVEITVPWTPGAVTDVLGRVLADGLSGELGQPFIVVNRPGATGSIGSAAVARAEPTGYSLLFTAAVSITVVPLINKQIGYDQRSFDPICQAFKNEMAIVVKPDSPIRTVTDCERRQSETERRQLRPPWYWFNSASGDDRVLSGCRS